MAEATGPPARQRRGTHEIDHRQHSGDRGTGHDDGDVVGRFRHTWTSVPPRRSNVGSAPANASECSAGTSQYMSRETTILPARSMARLFHMARSTTYLRLAPSVRREQVRVLRAHDDEAARQFRVQRPGSTDRVGDVRDQILGSRGRARLDVHARSHHHERHRARLEAKASVGRERSPRPSSSFSAMQHVFPLRRLRPRTPRRPRRSSSSGCPPGCVPTRES